MKTYLLLQMETIKIICAQKLSQMVDLTQFYFLSCFSDCRYHVHGDTPVGEFVDIIRHLVGSEKRIFFFFKNTKPSMGELHLIFILCIIFVPKVVIVNNSSVGTGSLMSAVYEENKGEDGFLHMTYSREKKRMIGL